jgi:hypothetical protein
VSILAFPKGPPLIIFLFLPLLYPVGTMAKQIKSSFFLTFFALSDAPSVGCCQSTSPSAPQQAGDYFRNDPLLEHYLTHNRRYNVRTLLMWIQLPTTQFDTTIWSKVVELLDVLCYLKGMHCIALASKVTTVGVQCPCIKRGEQETIHNRGYNLGTLLMRIWLPIHYGTTMW